ncbi:MAG: hypothetical protein NVSMB51_12950 [Solirubrobacteraceae bacterium]
MSATTPALIAAAAGIGFGHAVLPDHWVPLALVGRTRRYPLARVARLAGLAGVAHVIVSVALGAVLILVGLQLRSSVEQAQNAVVGTLLLLTGVVLIALEACGRGHHPHPHHDHHNDHHHEPHGHRQPDGRLRSLAGIMIPFGAAASPDLTILPVFVAASAAGTLTAIGALIVFTLVTVATIVTLTLLACFGGHQFSGAWLERWGNMLTGAVLIVIGGLVIGGLI